MENSMDSADFIIGVTINSGIAFVTPSRHRYHRSDIQAAGRQGEREADKRTSGWKGAGDMSYRETGCGAVRW